MESEQARRERLAKYKIERDLNGWEFKVYKDGRRVATNRRTLPMAGSTVNLGIKRFKRENRHLSKAERNQKAIIYKTQVWQMVHGRIASFIDGLNNEERRKFGFKAKSKPKTA